MTYGGPFQAHTSMSLSLLSRLFIFPLPLSLFKKKKSQYSGSHLTSHLLKHSKTIILKTTNRFPVTGGLNTMENNLLRVEC